MVEYDFHNAKILTLCQDANYFSKITIFLLITPAFVDNFWSFLPKNVKTVVLLKK